MKDKFRSLTVVLLITTVLLVAILYAYIEWFGRHTGPQQADVIIVLGAAVWPQGPSPALLERLSLAKKLYQEGYARAIITTGGAGDHNPVPEGHAAKLVLLEWGVPENAVYEELSSKNTRENLQGAFKIMQERGWDKAVLVTHDFHLLRAMKEARALGMTVFGAGVQETAMFRPPLILREVIANLAGIIGY